MKKGPLIEIDGVVPCDEFRHLLDPVWRKPMDVVLMFKALVTRFTETFHPAYG